MFPSPATEFPLDVKIKLRKPGLQYVASLCLRNKFSCLSDNRAGLYAALDYTIPKHLFGGIYHSDTSFPVVCGNCRHVLGHCEGGAIVGSCHRCKTWGYGDYHWVVYGICERLKISSIEARQAVISALLS